MESLLQHPLRQELQKYIAAGRSWKEARPSCSSFFFHIIYIYIYAYVGNLLETSNSPGPREQTFGNANFSGVTGHNHSEQRSCELTEILWHMKSGESNIEFFLCIFGSHGRKEA